MAPTKPQPAGFDLAETYVHLADGPAATPVEGGAAFWKTIEKRTDLHEGRLVTAFAMSGDWPHWEMHPAGDEIVYLLSGSADLILDDGKKQRTVELRGRSGCIVPRGVWHRAIVYEPGEALFITRGAGTQHRPV
jgi:mannose-6-phosphate isomerase-like protein (cupin superfamily)